MAPRLAVLVALALAAAAAVAHGEAGVRGAGTLRGYVACLDCAPGHDLSGVVVAVRCGGGDGGVGQLRAAQTDERGGFDVAVPVAGGDDVDGRRSHPRCAARCVSRETYHGGGGGDGDGGRGEWRSGGGGGSGDKTLAQGTAAGAIRFI
uniref:Uncharacterized protein n=1 Tax=Oryza glumipatula TaxID=40148 RepID=A0A0D9YT81_9ORYZ